MCFAFDNSDAGDLFDFAIRWQSKKSSILKTNSINLKEKNDRFIIIQAARKIATKLKKQKNITLNHVKGFLKIQKFLVDRFDKLKL